MSAGDADERPRAPVPRPRRPRSVLFGPVYVACTLAVGAGAWGALLIEPLAGIFALVFVLTGAAHAGRLWAVHNPDAPAWRKHAFSALTAGCLTIWAPVWFVVTQSPKRPLLASLGLAMAIAGVAFVLAVAATRRGIEKERLR